MSKGIGGLSSLTIKREARYNSFEIQKTSRDIRKSPIVKANNPYSEMYCLLAGERFNQRSHMKLHKIILGWVRDIRLELYLRKMEKRGLCVRGKGFLFLAGQ